LYVIERVNFNEVLIVGDTVRSRWKVLIEQYFPPILSSAFLVEPVLLKSFIFDNDSEINVRIEVGVSHSNQSAVKNADDVFIHQQVPFDGFFYFLPCLWQFPVPCFKFSVESRTSPLSPVSYFSLKPWIIF
jgi:hypothetical protein